jgi:hypothetical protein
MAVAVPAAIGLAEVGGALSTGLASTSAGLLAAEELSQLGSKFKPAISGIVNHNYHKTEKSAAKYIKGLTKPKGFKRLFTKDIGKVAGKTSKFISSGKALRKAGRVARDTTRALDLIEGVTGETEAGRQIRSGTKQALESVDHHHQVLEKYNDQGKALASQWKNPTDPNQQLPVIA